MSRVWGLHAGRHGEAEGLFLDQSRIAIGWRQVGDLGAIAADREALKQAIETNYPATTVGAIPVHAGVLYRFAHEIAVGELVVLPARRDRRVHVGTVTGKYEFVGDDPLGYVHQRTVVWKTSVPRTSLSQGALYEIGSAVTLFLIRNYAEEIRSVFSSGSERQVVEDDAQVAAVSEDIEEATRDFIHKRLAQELKGHPLAAFVAALLECMGFQTTVSPEGPDGGVDILAHKDALGFEPPIIKVQVKSTEGTVGAPVVQQLRGSLSGDEKGLVVTLGTFAPGAIALARTVPNIRLINGVGLVDLVLEHYESIESRYRAAIPLKRVYVPAPLEEIDDG